MSNLLSSSDGYLGKKKIYIFFKKSTTMSFCPPLSVGIVVDYMDNNTSFIGLTSPLMYCCHFFFYYNQKLIVMIQTFQLYNSVKYNHTNYEGAH